MSEQAHTITLGLTRKSLEATVIHACPHCEAPGVYKDDLRVKEKWPGCYSVLQHNHPVGANCPNCGKKRRRDLNLGELAASMPLWMWHIALAFKWCLIKWSMLTRA